MNHTVDFFIEKCRNLFLEKLIDYDLSWLYLKKYSIIDQIFIKTIRIKNINFKGEQSIKEEKITDTYIDIINYLIILLIKLDTFFISLKNSNNKISHDQIISFYNKKFDNLKNYMNNYFKYKICFDHFDDDLVDKFLYLKKNSKKILSKKLEEFYYQIIIEILFFLKKNYYK
ncbi:nucleotide modification associated domain-containing protein [Blattabacterium cuenoti]|uniref:nucleotide modification associated domain-containing protein n=1 Tax=Blattabacterium cuenoti TaxID=1653831 RepID=UPI00163C8341|nr:nucleotide modification associated domain-containing protein [Blattabacterium cuenoti]